MSGRAAELVADLVRTRGKDGRCRYHKAAKRELVRRCLEPGVSIAATALAHGVNANLLRKWVDALSDPVRPRGVRSLASAGTVLLPVRVAPEQARDLSPAPSAGYVEIALGGVTVRVHGRVDAESLRAVLNCVTSRA